MFTFAQITKHTNIRGRKLFFYLNYTLISKESLEYSLNKDLIEDQTEEEDETEKEKLEDFLEGL